MKLVKIKASILFLLVLFMGYISLGTGFNNIVLATEGDGGALGFYPTFEFPENQMAKDVGYFHLKMTPGQTQTIALTLNNPGKEAITVDISLNSAKTNANGVIDYGKTDIKNDPSLKFDFVDIVKGPESVEIAAGETKNVEFQIKMPETKYDGVIVGGIQFIKRNSAEKTDSGGSKVRNVYAYLMGLKLQETDSTLQPDLKLNKVYAEQFNYRNAIMVNFSNTAATYVEEMTTEVQISKQGTSNVLYETKKTSMRMAPNTLIDFPIDMNGEKMVKGDYIADILVTSGEQKWKWSEKFTITAEEAANFNERDVGLVQEKGLDWKIIAFIFLGLLCLFGIIFFILRFIRKNKQVKKKNRTKGTKSTKKVTKKKNQKNR